VTGDRPQEVAISFPFGKGHVVGHFLCLLVLGLSLTIVVSNFALAIFLRVLLLSVFGFVTVRTF
jgi:hypothetical protein